MANVVRFVREVEDAILPTKAHEDDACFDLYAAEDRVLYPETASYLISTGFKVAIPDGYVGLVCSRSGLAAKHGVFVTNSPGIIDTRSCSPRSRYIKQSVRKIVYNSYFLSSCISS